MAVTAPGSVEVLRFRALVEDVLGLRVEPGDIVPLQRILARRMAARGRDARSYLDELATRPRSEISALALELTVGETYFLRHMEQFDALTGHVLPELLRRPGRTGPLRLLSAGCSTGEETYSLAIAARQAGIAAEVTIVGVDTNPASIAKARSGRYNEWSLRAVPTEIRRRWFEMDAGDVVLHPAVRAAARFEQLNFADEESGFWQPDIFDVIFCRNVIMYFTPELMTSMVARFARVLAPGGYLFLGSAETLRGLSTDFELRQSHGTFYYQKARRPAEVAASSSFAPRPFVAPPGPTPPGPAPTGPAPTDPASTDVRPPHTSPPGRPAAEGSMRSPTPPDGFDTVLDLLGRERFAEALAAMDELAGPPDPDPEVLLVRAALLTHSGRLPAAERVCRQLLGIDRRSAGAHVLLAMCREGEDDLSAAVDHCRTAISYDPDFAMPHVHLGRLAGRMGDRGTASRQYAQSARLLPSETGRRILLFGGGFDREALIALCQAQGAATGGPR